MLLLNFLDLLSFLETAPTGGLLDLDLGQNFLAFQNTVYGKTIYFFRKNTKNLLVKHGTYEM